MAARHVRIIASLGNDRAIGIGGRIPWRQSTHLHRLVLGLEDAGALVVGRRTYEQWGAALAGIACRKFVVSASLDDPEHGFVRVASLQQAIDNSDGDLHVLGGARLFEDALPVTTFMELTLVDVEGQPADAWFPQWNTAEWDVLFRSEHAATDEDDHGSVYYFMARRDPTAQGDELAGVFLKDARPQRPRGH